MTKTYDSIPSPEAERILNGEGPGDTEDERFKMAAGIDVSNFFAALSRQYKPEDFMFDVGILFAQGFWHISKEEQDSILDEFPHRLRKYCGGYDQVRFLQRACREILKQQEDETV
jgi:hypothetical protein